MGSKRIGVAVCDELGITAQALTTVQRSGLPKDLDALRRLAQEQHADRIVIGLPVGMNGEEGTAAAAARKFGGLVEERLGLPVEFWDERLSTVAAERVLLEADLSRQKRRRVIDRVAAAIILQSWLDARGGARMRNPPMEPS